MAPLSSRCSKKDANRGAWTAEEDQKLAQVIEIHGPKRWKTIAAKAGKHRKLEHYSQKKDYATHYLCFLLLLLVFVF